MNQFKSLFYLTQIDGLGPIRIKKLIETFGSAEKVIQASEKALCEIEGFNKVIASSIVDSKKHFKEFEKSYGKLCKKIESIGCEVVSIEDEKYPKLLKAIYDPPLFLFVKSKRKLNELNEISQTSVAIVGTRNPTDYGKHMAEKLSHELCAKGLSIISGLARGVDTIAHKTALQSHRKNSSTIAVLGCGIDVIYPPENKKLFEEICEHGFIISEFEPGTPPDKNNFPVRNRIISGISLGTIIIESGINGGALITARYANDQSREVFALPGFSTSKYSRGTNMLIKTGQAKLVEEVDDVISELSAHLNISSEDSEEQTKNREQLREEILGALKGNERAVFSIMNNNGAVHIDQISETSGLNISDCLVTLLNLEFKNLVRQLPGKRFEIML